MEPVMHKENRVILSDEKDYNSGDILAYSTKDSDEIFICKCLINGDTISFIPISNKYDIKSYKTSDVFIVGKVKSIIKDI